VQIAAKISDDIKVPSNSFWQKMPFIAFMLGVVCILYWIFAFKVDPYRAMYGYLFAFLCVLSIALGAMFFVVIQHLSRAGWSVVVRRIAEFTMWTMPLMLVLFLPIAFWAKNIFPWIHIDPGDVILEKKAPYLSLNFFMIRATIYFAIWLGIGWWFYKTSVGQDDGKRIDDTRKFWAMSAPAVILFGMSLTFASIDWLMSLQPHWFSTIFGVYFFSGCFLAGMAFVTIILLGLQAGGILTKTVTFEHYQDLGKLMFGFTVFWAYIAFSQFMLYWYANIPEETEFYIHRLQHGWEYMSYAIPITNFFLPFFFLMSRHVKRNKIALAFFCCWTLLAHFFDLYWTIMPNFGAHGLPEGMPPPHASIAANDLILLVGMLGLFVAYVSYFIVRKNLIPIGDPKLAESLHFENA
jgi:hypothetical protein